MASFPDFAVRQLQRSDVPLMGSMMTVFGDAFKEVDTYTRAPPSTAYLERLLGGSHLIALAATKDGVVVGGLVAYELQKFEQERTRYTFTTSPWPKRTGVRASQPHSLENSRY